MKVFVLFCTSVFLLASISCGQSRFEISKLEYSNPVNTANKEIELQAKRKYEFPAKRLTVDNLFDGARLNRAEMEGNTLKIFISPENIPINGSPWYAFRLIARKKQTITIELNYTHSTHRYQPKWSRYPLEWTPIDADKVTISKSGDKASFSFTLQTGETWIAAQEVISSSRVNEWCTRMARQKYGGKYFVGYSALGKEILALSLASDVDRDKPTIVILGRQHPPEVTGHLALQAFVERLMKNEHAKAFFEKYRVLVIPMINPDGVDLGHWRHNAQGVDLNRDYAEYQQPEIKALTSFLAKMINEEKVRIIMGLDFHSTYEDVYYTNQEKDGVLLNGFENEWLNAIGTALAPYNYQVKTEQHSVTSNPSAQHWFYRQFKALGITYEIGDDTDREFIKQKAKVSADALVKLLLERDIK